MDKTNSTPKADFIPVNSGITFAFKGTKSDGSILSTLMGGLLSLVMLLLLAGGAMYTLITMFSLPVNNILFPIIAGIFALATVVLYMLPKKAMLISLGALAAATIGFTVVFLDKLLDGLLYIRDGIIYGISLSMCWPVATLSYSVNEVVAPETTVALLLIAFILILILGFFTVRKIGFLVPALITFMFFEIGAAFGCVPNHLAFAALLSGWTGLFAMSAAIRVRKFKARKKDKKKTKVKPIDYKKSFISSIGVLIATLTFLVFLLSSYIVSSLGYDRPENMKELRNEVKDVVIEVIEYILGQDNDGTLNEGQLYLLGERIIKNRDQMVVELPLRSSVYLKGYIGEDYKGDKWDALKEDSDYKALMKKAEATGYYPQALQGLLLEELQYRNDIVKDSIATVTVKELRRKKDYAYLAYIPQLPEGFTPNGTTKVAPNNSDEYSYNAFLSDTNFFLMNLADLYYTDDFKSVMNSYYNYVKTHYTAIPDGMEELKTIVDDLISGKKYGYSYGAASNLEIADRIRKYLADNTTYSLTPSTLPAGKDFVKHFVLESKEGYAPHYATALAVMLRLAGVPTRYVEGFIANHEDYNKAEKNSDGYYELELTDKNSHAWIEVYEKNYGWISIEATPGFYSESLTENMGSILEELPPDITEELEPPEEFTPDETVPEEQPSGGDGYILDADSEGPEEELPDVETKDELLEPEPTLWEKILNVLKYIGLFLLVAILSFMLIASGIMLALSSRRKYRLIALDKAFASGNRNRKILTVYRYYEGMLKFERLENKDSLPYMQYAKEICSKSRFLRGEQHTRAMSIFLKYRFSNQPLSDNELKCLERVMGDYQNNAFKSLKGKELFRFKYIDNLG